MQYYNINFLLFYKWVLFNSIIAYLLYYFYHKGWLTLLIVSDISFITPLIMGLTLIGVVLSGVKAFNISNELFKIKNNKGVLGYIIEPNVKVTSLTLESVKLVLSSRLYIIRYIAWSLVVLGLIGTVLGFIIVLSSIDPNVVGNVELIGQLMGNITNGLGVALYTTLAGSFGNLWILINYNMLQTATIQLYSKILMSVKDV